jgi:hypothetical protein
MEVVLHVGSAVISDRRRQGPGWFMDINHLLVFVLYIIFSNGCIGIGRIISCGIADIIEFLKRGNYNACIDDVQMIQPRKFESFADLVQ